MRKDYPIGFTLMELIVAMGIFAISVGFIADLFLAATRQQARTASLSRLQGDARLVLDQVTSAMRDGAPDYDPQIPSNILAMHDGSGGSRVQFQRVATGCPPGSTACVRIGRPNPQGALEWALLTGNDVTVDAFSFRRVPDRDPFAPASQGAAPDVQPYVTIRVALSAPGGRPGQRVRVEAQTTVVSRTYRR